MGSKAMTSRDVRRERSDGWRDDLPGQWTRLRRLLLLVTLAVGGLLAVVAAVAVRHDLQMSTLMADPLAMAGVLPIYTGIVSTMTGLVWSATAAVCLFTAALPSRTRSEERSFLAAAGCLTALLLADDVFQVHDGFSRRAFGIDEKLVYVGYALMAVSLLLRYLATIAGTDDLPLVIGLGAFAVSVAIDQVAAFHPILLEDGAKLIGLAGWGTYLVVVCASRLAAAEAASAA